jgi:hypothetical protein
LTSENFWIRVNYSHQVMSFERYSYMLEFMLKLCTIDDSSKKCFEYIKMLAHNFDGIIFFIQLILMKTIIMYNFGNCLIR